MEVRYNKMNDFKSKFKDADWNDPAIQLDIMRHLDYAKAEGWCECMDMLKEEGLLTTHITAFH